MPQAGQIVPSYTVPHVMTVINDNTVFEENVTSNPSNSPRLLCVFPSTKGEDGVIKYMNSTTEYLAEYGTPNFNLYGQACLMPYAALFSGNARVACMRIMAPDATYSNIVVVAKVKRETIIEVDPETNIERDVEKVFIKYETVSIDKLIDKNSFGIEMEALTVPFPEVDDEGYSTYPIIGFKSKGRGIYGNSLRVRISSDINSDAENDYKNYMFEVLSSETTLVRKELFRCTLDESAVVSHVTLSSDDVLNDVEVGSGVIESYTSVANMHAIYDMYVDTLVDKTTAIPYEQFDFITGLTKDKLPIENYVVEEDGVALDRIDGMAFEAGSDGAFGADILDEVREAAMTAEYVKAFSGTGGYDKAIRSKRRTPVEWIMDANFPQEVKLAMVELALHRYDARLILDAGILSTTTQCEAWLENIKPIHDPIISKETQHYLTRDPFTQKVIPVTTTYFMAQYLPPHVATFGNQTPFVGENYALLTGHIKNSLKPVIDADDLPTKEKLYLARANFFECIAENTFIRGTQGTSQNYWSDLSEENNMEVVLDMKRQLETFVSARLYNFAEPEDRKRFTDDADRMFADYRNKKCREFSVRFDMNPWEEERSIIHCYLEVVFKTLAKRGIIEIDINKRV